MDLNKRRLDQDLREEVYRNKRMRADNGELQVGLLLMNRDVGQVMGKGGQKIKAIRAESGARVNIASLIPNSSERIGDVTGSIEEVSAAVQMIASSISEDRPCITLLAESKNLGAVIGKGGATINKIRTESQANVDIGRECLGDSSQKDIRIEGDTESVSQAIHSIVTNLAEGTSEVRVPYIPHGGGAYKGPMGRRDRGSRGDRVEDYRGGVGRGGAGRGGRFNMPFIFQERSMQFQDRPYGNPSRGRPSSSGLRIETLVYVAKDLIGKIIGRGGSNINTVRRESGATIAIATTENNEPERKITISGGRESMNIACSMIEDLATSF